VIALTESGKLARLVCKYRPSVPILAISVSETVVHQLQVTRGVTACKMPSFAGTEGLVKTVTKMAKEMGLCKAGNMVVVLHGQNEETPDESNIMKIICVE